MEEYDQELENELMEVAFGEVTETSREIFQKLGREFGDSEVIFREGDEGSCLYIILSGAVSITKKGDDGTPLELARLEEGEILGEMSHFDELPRSATATACGVTQLLVFSRANFSLIFQLHPKWTTKLVAGLSQRISNSIKELRS